MPGPTRNTPLLNDQLREHNRLLVYRCVRRQPGARLSRTDITRDTKLSVPTISAILREFTALGVVEEVGQSVTRGGRPAQLVSFRPEAFHVLAVDLSAATFQAALVDLLGRPAQRFKAQHADSGRLEAWLGEILSQARAQHNVERLAIAVPGVVERGTGNVKMAPALGLDDYPLAARLARSLGLPVLLENDVNSLANAELHYGQSADLDDVIYLSITSGIGVGIVTNRQIYRGSSSAAGEIGYSTLVHIPRQEGPRLGRPGALEEHLFGLARKFTGPEGIDLSSEGAREAFGHFSQDLSVIVHNIVCLLNPERLVVSWPLDGENLLTEELARRLNAPVPVEVSASSLGADGALLGVARLALDELEVDLCSTAWTTHGAAAAAGDRPAVELAGGGKGGTSRGARKQGTARVRAPAAAQEDSGSK